jgi:hypothetical protein
MKYIYKSLPFIGDVSSKDRNIFASKASEQLTKLINSNAVSGWEFVQINTVNIYKAGESPGCLASLFGATGIADTTEKYDMVIFRKELSENELKNIGEEMKKINDNFENIDDDSENNPKVIETKKLAQPHIQKLERIGYILVKQNISEKKCYWVFNYKSTDSTYEFDSINKLKEYADNF